MAGIKYGTGILYGIGYKYGQIIYLLAWIILDNGRLAKRITDKLYLRI